MNMQTTSYPVGLSTRRIHLQLSSELCDTWNIRSAHTLIPVLCISIIVAILGVILYSAIGAYSATPAAYSASLHVDAGTVYVLKAETDERVQVDAGGTLLLDIHDQVIARAGEATITFFDGSTHNIEESVYYFENPSNSLNSTDRLKRHWLRRVWSPSVPFSSGARPVNSAASVLG